MSGKRFTVRRDENGAILIPNSILKDGEIIDENEVVDLLNRQQTSIETMLGNMEKLEKENRELRQKIKHWVYVDVDNANGCMNCKYDKGSICSILDCGTHNYIDGVSECGLKYWEYKNE